MFFLDLDIKSHKQPGLLLICETSDEKEGRVRENFFQSNRSSSRSIINYYRATLAPRDA